MTAPQYRAIPAHSPEVAPVSMAGALVIVDAMRAEVDLFQQQRDDARAELDNIRSLLMSATETAHRVSCELVHALRERDEVLEKLDDAERQMARDTETIDVLDDEIVELRNQVADARAK